jgi:hypothetical protein
MKKTIVVLALFTLTTVCAIVPSHAQTNASRNLYFYGARLPYETVQVTVYAQEGDKTAIKGAVTMTHEQWVAFAKAVVDAGFGAAQGEPKPIGLGSPD